MKMTKKERETEKANLWDLHERALKAELEETARVDSRREKSVGNPEVKATPLKKVFSSDLDVARVYLVGAQHRVFTCDQGLQTAFADKDDAIERAKELDNAMEASEKNLYGADDVQIVEKDDDKARIKVVDEK